jgi:trimeric autotransporter adhesin
MTMKNGLFLSLCFALLCLGVPLPVCAQIPNRISAPLDETQRVTLAGNVHPLAQARFDRGPAPASNPTGRIMLVLRRSVAQQQALTQYLADLQNPSSANYHKWLTPAQYGARFGISDADLATVESWLQTQGFTIVKVPQARNVIEFSGNFAQIQNAFHTSIHRLVVNGATHFANWSDPQIPAALAPVVAGVGPLNDFRPQPPVIDGPRGQFNGATRRIEPAFTLSVSGSPYLFVDPADAATIYDTPNTSLNANYASGTTYDGSGVTIGIGGISDVTMADIDNYRTGFLGESAANANLPTVVVDGNDPGLVAGWDTEALLDNEVSGGLAPGAKVYFYTSADTDIASGMFNAIYRALDDNVVSILSLSVQACEAGLGNSGNQIILEASEQAAAQGITVVVAAGDSGSAGCDNFDTETVAQDGFAVNGYASSPWVVAAGGTDFDTLPANFTTYANATTSGTAPYWRTALQYIPENPWNDSTTVNTNFQNNEPATSSSGTNIVAGGGGQSSCATQTTSGTCTAGYAKPPFQVGLTPADTVRDVPDVAFLAASGQYQALWVLCSDSVTDGSSQTYTDCQNTNGQFASDTYFGGVGGTSAAAPAFAGMLALVAEANGSASDNYRLGQADFILYQLAKSDYSTVFHDVVTGNNSVPCESSSPDCGPNNFLLGYNAGSNYDLASGLGSVDVSALAKNWGNVKLGSTSTSLTLNGSTAAYSGVHGASVTFSVGVNPASATGLAGIIDTADENAGGPLNNGQIAIPLTSGAGSLPYNGLPGGQYTVSARYGGDSGDAASTSNAISVNIAPEASTTTLTVNAYNPLTGAAVPATDIPYGSLVFADAQITGTAEGSKTQGVATGTVTFQNGSTTLGTATVSSGNEASWPPLSKNGFVALAPGSYSLTASYSGDASYNRSASTAAPLTVAQDATNLIAGVPYDPIYQGQVFDPVSVDITTPYNAGAAPTGTVVLAVNGTTVATITGFSTSVVGSGSSLMLQTLAQTSLEGSQLPAGNLTINVTYSGDANYLGSSTSFPLQVNASTTPAIALTNSGNITVAAGASTGNTSTITVTPSNGVTGGVNLSCSVTTTLVNPNDPPTCSVTSPVTINGATAVTSTLTVLTTASVTTGALSSPLTKFFLGSGAALALIFFFGIPARRRTWRTLCSLAAVLFAVGAVGCGGGGGSGGGPHTIPGTTAGTYSIAVTGISQANSQVTASTTVTLTVN